MQIDMTKYFNEVFLFSEKESFQSATYITLGIFSY